MVDVTTALRKIGLPAVVVSREGRITWQNDAGIALFGDLRGSFWGVTVAPEDGARAREQFEQKVNGNAVSTSYDVDVVTRDGQRVRAEISSVVIEGDDPERAILALARIDRELRSAAEKLLTPRQNQVLQLLARGASTEQMATELQLTKETVRNYVRNVLRALGAHSRLEAVAIARRRGLV